MDAKIRFVPPWLCHRPVKGVLDSKTAYASYYVQAKIDGHRAMVVHHFDGSVNVWSRAGKEARWPAYMYRLAQALPLGTYLDGELFPNEERCLLPPPYLASTVGHLRTAKPDSLDYFVFDILFYNGLSHMHKPYSDRWALVKWLVELYSNDFYQLRVPPNLRDWCVESLRPLASVAPREFMDYMLELGFEGIVMKARAARYASGSRCMDAIKFKHTQTVTVLVTDMDSKPTPWRVRPGAVNKQTGKVCPAGIKTATAQNNWRTLSYGYWNAGLGKMVRIGSLGVSGPPEELEKEIGRRYDIKVWGVNPETGALRHPVYHADRSDEFAVEEITLESIVNGW